jgi:nucleolar protein 16
LNDPLNDLSDEENTPKVARESTSVVKELERQAAIEGRKKPRHQSQREQQWIQDLVEKYGDDFGKMARDTKLNIYQQSEGDIKRRVKKWQKS